MIFIEVVQLPVKLLEFCPSLLIVLVGAESCCKRGRRREDCAETSHIDGKGREVTFVEAIDFILVFNPGVGGSKLINGFVIIRTDHETFQIRRALLPRFLMERRRRQVGCLLNAFHLIRVARPSAIVGQVELIQRLTIPELHLVDLVGLDIQAFGRFQHS